MKQADLEQRTGLKQSDISRWERGLRQPNADQLDRLAEVLAVPVRTLCADVRLSHPVHRTARQETKLVERQVNARLELCRMAVSRLLEDIDIDAPFIFPGPDEPAPADPEAAAEALRRVWRVGSGPLPDLCSLVESAGALVLPVDFGTDSVLAAYSHKRGDHRWCFVNSRTRDGARLRFSLAHELGHAVLHWDRFDAPIGRDAEREAQKFAAAFLMPREDMHRLFARGRLGFGDLMILRTQWRVSMQALIMRASELGLVTAQAKQSFFIQMSRRGWRIQEPGEIEPERPTMVAEALDLHRSQHEYTEAEIAELAGLSLERMSDLMPELFTYGRRTARLRVVR